MRHWIVGKFWLWFRRDEMRAMVERIADARLRPAMEQSYGDGFSDGTIWLIDRLLDAPFTREYPDLREWLLDTRAGATERHVSEHR